jgi:hypothetical protein
MDYEVLPNTISSPQLEIAWSADVEFTLPVTFQLFSSQRTYRRVGPALLVMPPARPHEIAVPEGYKLAA